MPSTPSVKLDRGRRGVLVLGGKLDLHQLAFTPKQVVAAAVAQPDAMTYGGVYFLVWRGMVVYVGKARSLWERVFHHSEAGKPHECVAVIAGLSEGKAAAVEDCYARAWSPPWNAMTTSGNHPDKRRLRAALENMDRSLVMPKSVPRGGHELAHMPTWRAQVLGTLQREAADVAPGAGT